ncbi:hypothetical protein FRX31_027517, partial [Thalictrum thalictroides]
MRACKITYSTGMQLQPDHYSATQQDCQGAYNDNGLCPFSNLEPRCKLPPSAVEADVAEWLHLDLNIM